MFINSLRWSDPFTTTDPITTVAFPRFKMLFNAVRHPPAPVIVSGFLALFIGDFDHVSMVESSHLDNDIEWTASGQIIGEISPDSIAVLKPAIYQPVKPDTTVSVQSVAEDDLFGASGNAQLLIVSYQVLKEFLRVPAVLADPVVLHRK